MNPCSRDATPPPGAVVYVSAPRLGSELKTIVDQPQLPRLELPWFSSSKARNGSAAPRFVFLVMFKRSAAKTCSGFGFAVIPSASERPRQHAHGHTSFFESPSAIVGSLSPKVFGVRDDRARIFGSVG